MAESRDICVYDKEDQEVGNNQVMCVSQLKGWDKGNYQSWTLFESVKVLIRYNKSVNKLMFYLSHFC